VRLLLLELLLMLLPCPSAALLLCKGCSGGGAVPFACLECNHLCTLFAWACAHVHALCHRADQHMPAGVAMRVWQGCCRTRLRGLLLLHGVVLMGVLLLLHLHGKEVEDAGGRGSGRVGQAGDANKVGHTALHCFNPCRRETTSTPSPTTSTRIPSTVTAAVNAHAACSATAATLCTQ